MSHSDKMKLSPAQRFTVLLFRLEPPCPDNEPPTCVNGTLVFGGRGGQGGHGGRGRRSPHRGGGFGGQSGKGGGFFGPRCSTGAAPVCKNGEAAV